MGLHLPQLRSSANSNRPNYWCWVVCSTRKCISWNSWPHIQAWRFWHSWLGGVQWHVQCIVTINHDVWSMMSDLASDLRHAKYTWPISRSPWCRRALQKNKNLAFTQVSLRSGKSLYLPSCPQELFLFDHSHTPPLYRHLQRKSLLHLSSSYQVQLICSHLDRFELGTWKGIDRFVANGVENSGDVQVCCELWGYSWWWGM